MDIDPTLINYSRVTEEDGGTAWSVLYGNAVIGRIQRHRSFGRGFSKSQMCTRHIMVWSSTVADVGLSGDDHRAVQRQIRRDKTSREAAVEHIIEAYACAGVQLPIPEDQPRAA